MRPPARMRPPASHRLPPRPRTAGFVLAATLWALAALAILASYVDGVVAAEVERARLARAALQHELDQRATEATLLFLLATERHNHHAVLLTVGDAAAARARQASGQLGIAGQAYAGFGDVAFSAQDERGLVSVNLPGEPAFAALLRRVGMPRPDADRAVARLRDYIDVDDALSLGGAEGFDYARRGLAPPKNHLLAVPMELRRVLGLDEVVAAEQWRRLLPLLTPRVTIGYNFNTMRAEAMAALLGVDEAAVAPLLAARAERPIAGLADVQALTGALLALDPELVVPVPSNALRLAFWRRGADSRTVVGITLTPVAQAAPWRKEYRYSEPLAEGQLAAGGAVPEAPATPLLRSVRAG